MNAPVIERTSAARAGWVVLALMFGWLIFVFVPAPQKPMVEQPAVKPAPPSKLAQVGLRDSVDWDGLPEIFAIWADWAEWKGGRTRFAYWHPVMRTYSYYFEASRAGETFRFKEIVEPKESGYHWDETLGEGCPIRFYRSDSNDPSTSKIEMPKMDEFRLDPATKPGS